MKKILTITTAVVLGLALFTVSCKKDILVTEVSLNKTTATIMVDDTLRLIPIIGPANAKNQTVTWSSSAPSKATVVDGLVTALDEGVVTITVTTVCGNKTATCVITIEPLPIPVAEVKLNVSRVNLMDAETRTLIHTVLPEDASNKAVIWGSSDNSIATVLNGVITAVAAGEAVITVTTEDGNKKATCSVTVFSLSFLNCLPEEPGWGTSLGTVSFATPQEWTITKDGVTQIWSDAVQASNCSNKTTFAGGANATGFRADCRSNPSQKGDLFSWCAVARFRDVLCPYPWRVPTDQDFVNLDLLLGGNGRTRTSLAFVNDNYIARWGGTYSGTCTASGALRSQNVAGEYWASVPRNQVPSNHAFTFGFENDGFLSPDGLIGKANGHALRCVR